MKRYAIIRNADSRRQAERLLPDNYRIVHEDIYYPEWSRSESDEQLLFVIEGEDAMGWTLDKYVIPRYASANIQVEEIDLSHPIMREVPINA